MERDSGQISVDSTPFQQHQFFPGGGGTQLLHPSGRSLSSVNRGESPWLAGANWSSSGSQHGECSFRRDEWRTKSWDWDSVAFTAQRANGATGATGGPGWDMPRMGVNGDYRKDSEANLRGTGTPEANHQIIQIDDDDETELRGQTFFGRETPSPPLNEANPYNRGDDSPEDDGPLSLKLGGNVYEYLEENGVRNGKHGRSSSPQSQLPTCQVDGCTADLSKAKDYHRRHKVCEMHSKAGKALVGRVMQRFCQQCSRFHPLDQFDEGKRSCRRRLAGHNKRRRKTQPDPAVSQAFMMAEGQANGKSSDILTLLSVLSKIQGPLERTNNAASDQDILLRCLRQAGCLPTNGLEDLNRVAPSWSQLLRNSELLTSQVDPSLLIPQSSGLNTLLSPVQQEAYSLMLQNNLKQVARVAEENLMSRVGMNGLSGIMPYGLSVAEASISQAGSFQRPDEQASIARGMPHSPPIRLPGAIDPAQLLASVALTMQQNSQSHYSGIGHSMSAPLQNVPPPYSSFETRDFINERLDKNQERDTSSGSQVDRQAPWLTNAALNSHKGLFSETQQALQRPSIDLQRPLSQQGSDSSQSGSPSGQQSPGTPEAIWENRNSRISIKLFDKHPGQFPEGLRTQIDKWLSHRPSDMESYIRPGCIILTVFLSMPESAWVELVEDLSGSLKRLLISSSCDFWCTGRILVQVEQQSVLIIDGEIIGCRVSDPLNSPYIQSVRPLAIMSGQQTSLVVTGLNLSKTGTRLLCAFNGKYLSEEVFEHYGTDDEEVASGGGSDAEGDAVPSSSLPNSNIRQGETVVTIAVSSNSVLNAADDQTGVATHIPGGEPTILDEAEVSGEVSTTIDHIYDEDVNPRIQAVVQVNGTFGISGMSSSFGRCFIEVDQDTLEGNWKPIIVADGPICAEVRSLELEIEAAAHKAGEAAKQQGLQPSAVHCCMELARLVEEEEVACFLHELGWFFQRSYVQYCDGSFHASQVSSLRLKQLLVYSVERNWCAVVTKLLDIAFGNEDFDAAFIEFSAALQEEVSLLHRAVRKKCRPMVELLLSYSPSFLLGFNDTNSKSFQQKLEFKAKWGSIFKPDMRGPAGLTPLHIAATIKDAEHIVDALTSDPGQVGLRAWLTVQDDSGETPLSCALVGGNRKAVQIVRAKLAHLENPDNTTICITPDSHWDQHLRGDFLVQLELPVWKTSAIMEASVPPRDSEPVNCRDVDFLRLPPHVGGVKGAIYRPFLVSIMSIACICVCVCLLLKSPPHLEYVVSPFSWELLEQGFQ